MSSKLASQEVLRKNKRKKVTQVLVIDLKKYTARSEVFYLILILKKIIIKKSTHYIKSKTPQTNTSVEHEFNYIMKKKKSQNWYPSMHEKQYPHNDH